MYKLLLNHLPLYGCTIVYPFTEGYLGCFQVLALWLNLHYAVFCVGILPESSSSSQGISLKGWAVSVENDVASDLRCRTACLFQASGFLLYFDKSIRSEVWHFQSSTPPQPRFIVSRNHCCPSNRVPASAILSESALLLSTSSYLSYT